MITLYLHPALTHSSFATEKRYPNFLFPTRSDSSLNKVALCAELAQHPGISPLSFF